MGGVVTDLDGRHGVAGLYAVGECACTGLHGANRLASNSLVECFVFGRRAALAALDEPEPSESHAAEPEHAIAPPPTRETRTAVWRLAGLERTEQNLRELLNDPHPARPSRGRLRARSRGDAGAHARAEFPEPDPALDGRHSVLSAASETPSFVAWL
jgi:L-aspartate oxidase